MGQIRRYCLDQELGMIHEISQETSPFVFTWGVLDQKVTYVLILSKQGGLPHRHYLNNKDLDFHNAENFIANNSWRCKSLTCQKSNYHHIKT
jgi:hypothetical protein